MSSALKDVAIYKSRWEKLKDDTKDALKALTLAPQKVKDFFNEIFNQHKQNKEITPKMQKRKDNAIDR